MRRAIITDSNVAPLYGSQFEGELFIFPAGEEHKTRATKEHLENQLFEKGFGRDTCIVALGGGVVNDLAGFLAATYCRGVPLVLIPTTLLAMVDASIGGKNGVNTPFGKNMVGTFYPPQKVIIDTRFLETLPPREFLNGKMEMIKHGLIADSALFASLEGPYNLEKVIFENRRIKEEIVQADEKETGMRHI